MSVGLLVAATMLAGCGNGSKPAKDAAADQTATPATDSQATAAPEKLDPITFTVFIRDPQQVPSKDNKIIKKITELTGVTLEFEFLVGDLQQKEGVMLASGDYPDLIFAETNKFLDAGAYIGLEKLINDNAPNLKKHYEPYWEKMKEVSGGDDIRVLDLYGVQYGESTETWHSQAGFWIQKDVLAEAGYPLPKTLDEYFKLIEDYTAKHPTTADGQPTIGFEVLSDGWRAFCLKNPPQHLNGGGNNGGVYVNPDTDVAEVLTDKDYSRAYYLKLNEEFQKGVISPDTFTQSYDQYMAKLSTGRVLGMFDQHWNFQDAENVLIGDKKYGQTYVPVPLTYEGKTDYYREELVFAGINGLGITKNCKDPERLIKFLDFMVQEDTQKLLTWGIEGEDYTVDDKGIMHRNPDVIVNDKDPTWRRNNTGRLIFNYMPHGVGRFSDGNTILPEESDEEVFDGMNEYDKEFFKAYGVRSQVDFLSNPPKSKPYYPVWAMNLGDGSPAAVADQKIQDLQLKYLPRAIMAPQGEFDKVWDEFKGEIQKANPKAYEDKINELIQQTLAK